MKYPAARAAIDSGHLLAWSHRGWCSLYDLQVQAVRLFTQSEYCHVGIAWAIGDRRFVLEAVSAGVRIFPLSRLLPFYWLPTDGLWTMDAEAFALSKVGERYSKLQAIEAYLGRLTAGADNAWQCAEYAAMVLKVTGHGGLDRDTTPSKLVAAMLARGSPLHLITEG